MSYWKQNNGYSKKRVWDFEDDFNRSDEALSASANWIASIYGGTDIISSELREANGVGVNLLNDSFGPNCEGEFSVGTYLFGNWIIGTLLRFNDSTFNGYIIYAVPTGVRIAKLDLGIDTILDSYVLINNSSSSNIGATIYNNILYSNNPNLSLIGSNVVVDQSANLSNQNASQLAFVNEGGNNYHIQPTSTAKDAGIDRSSDGFAHDIDLDIRNVWDIGMDEN